MRQVKAIASVSIAMLASGVIAVSAASAAEGEILGGSTTSTTADTGTATFEATNSSIIVKCTSSEGTRTKLSNTEATFDDLFLGCTAAGAKCTGLNDTTAGSILVKGKIELLAFKNGGTLDLAQVDSYTQPVHFECLAILTEIKGSVIGLVTNMAGSVSRVITTTMTGSKGVQVITSVNGNEHILLLETGGSAFGAGSLTRLVSATLTSEAEVMY